ncbi:hypothetical protein WJX81_001465 [Elliptochloris bilobata]|uniref:Methyltransferase-like protein n=1 Tax=Elliptochloris bilobata TaxID=381761 RepID=A0AAW1S7I3_9CHLO
MERFVGGRAPAASEYHCRDFEWEEVRRDAEAALEAELAVLRSDSPGSDKVELANRHQALPLASGTGRRGRGVAPVQPWGDDAANWERFHLRCNKSARFYKERRYLLLEFPALARTDPSPRVVELGCGAGSSLLPVLKANPGARAIATDLSPAAVDMFRSAAASAGICLSRYEALVFDAADSLGLNPLDGANADCCLLVFTLGALREEAMPRMLRSAFQALRPGGLLMFRDHGLYDVTQLRWPPAQRLARNLCHRQDGTTAYFFEPDRLRQLVEGAGFVARECEWACTRLLNRKRGLEMRRVFVHGLFERPLES